MSAAPAGALERPVAQNAALADLPLTGPGWIGYAALGDGESVTDETIQGLEAKLAGRGRQESRAPGPASCPACRLAALRTRRAWAPNAEVTLAVRPAQAMPAAVAGKEA